MPGLQLPEPPPQAHQVLLHPGQLQPQRLPLLAPGCLQPRPQLRPPPLEGPALFPHLRRPAHLRASHLGARRVEVV